MARRAISGLASEQVTVVGWVSADWLVLAGHVVQHPPYEGIPIIGTRDDGVHFPPGFVLALAPRLSFTSREKADPYTPEPGPAPPE